MRRGLGKDESQPGPSKNLILNPIHCRLSLEVEGERRRSQGTLQDAPHTLRGLSAGEGQPVLWRLPGGSWLGDDSSSVPRVSLCCVHRAPAERCLPHLEWGMGQGMAWGQLGAPSPSPAHPQVFTLIVFPSMSHFLFPRCQQWEVRVAPSHAGTDLLSGFVLSATSFFVGRVISYEIDFCEYSSCLPSPFPTLQLGYGWAGIFFQVCTALGVAPTHPRADSSALCQ